MARVNTWKGNEFIALASDTNFDYPVGGFYSGYYAMMVVRHMYEFGTTVEQLAQVSVKNHKNALNNPYAQKHLELTVEDVRNSPMVAYPLTLLDICTMSEGAAVCILASEQMAAKLTDKPVLIRGIGTGTDAMRMSDRPHMSYDEFIDQHALPHEQDSDAAKQHYRDLWEQGFRYPGVHSFRAGRSASQLAYRHAGVNNPIEDLDFVELHDAYTSSEIQTYEDMGLCRYGEGGGFIERGHSTMEGAIPVNPSGGLLACGHPVGATGLMQAVFAFWQLQGTVGKHFNGDATLQIKNARRGAIHSHAGTGTYVTVTIMEKGV